MSVEPIGIRPNGQGTGKSTGRVQVHPHLNELKTMQPKKSWDDLMLDYLAQLPKRDRDRVLSAIAATCPRPAIFLGLPIHPNRPRHPEWESMLDALLKTSERAGLDVEVGRDDSDKPIALKRESLARYAARQGFRLLAFMDDDVFLQPTGLADLTNTLSAYRDDSKVAIVAAHCAARLAIPLVRSTHSSTPLRGWKPGDILDVPAVPFGAVLIRVDALQQLDRAFLLGSPDLWFPLQVTLVGEDTGVCYRLRDHGWRILTDTAIPACHWDEANQTMLAPPTPYPEPIRGHLLCESCSTALQAIQSPQ